MTKKNYLTDSYITEFKASVQDFKKHNDKYALILDETFFYPEGGGQPSDIGFVGDFKVTDVVLENDVPFHLIDSEIDSSILNTDFDCKIDFKRRFSFMQQHTGQHILSACAEKLYDATTIGFHIGDNYVTIDLDKKLNEAQLEAIEALANEVIFSNKSVFIHYPDKEALDSMPLRKQPKFYENIRIVEIDGFDFSPCGGTHTKTTSEVGILKIKRTENYKSGIRLEFVCGQFALDVFRKQNYVINSLTSIFSVNEDGIIEHSKNLLGNLKSQKRELHDFKKHLLELDVKNIVNSNNSTENVKVITLIEENMDMNALRLKCSLICNSPNFIVLASSTQNDKHQIVLAKSKEGPEALNKIEMNTLFKKHLEPKGAKGGGNSIITQCGINASFILETCLEEIKNDIESFIS